MDQNSPDGDALGTQSLGHWSGRFSKMEGQAPEEAPWERIPTASAQQLLKSRRTSKPHSLTGIELSTTPSTGPEKKVCLH